MGKKQFSYRRVTWIMILSVVIPLFLVIMTFHFYAVNKQQEAALAANYNTLTPYRDTMLRTMDAAEGYISTVCASDLNFQSMYYSKTRTDTYLAAQAIASTSKTLLSAYELAGGFFLYTKNFDTYYPSHIYNYPISDLELMKSFIRKSAENPQEIGSRWTALTLSDRRVLFRMAFAGNSVFAAMIDPSLQNVQIDSSLIFYTQNKNDILNYSGFSALRGKPEYEQLSKSYRIIDDSVGKGDLQIHYAVPKSHVFLQMDMFQRFLLAATLALFLILPILWFAMRRMLLKPIEGLVSTMQGIEEGKELSASETGRIREFNKIGKAFNRMIEQIRLQKIEGYEQQLEVQQAKLQFLQLQIRPHFFLNCLNILYSLAQEKKTEQMQSMILELSAYLRNLFKDNLKLVPLGVELKSLGHYMNLLKVEAGEGPQLNIAVDEACAKIPVPPLSVLSFVENCVKHGAPIEGGLKIQVSAKLYAGEQRDYLDITIRDNGKGFSEESLKSLNSELPSIYSEKHVGISNVRHRLHILYGDKAYLSFQNHSGGYVDVFLPIVKGDGA